MEKLLSRESPSLKNHRRQRFWQILFPIILVSIGLFASMILLVFSSRSQNRLMADISTIWLVFPLLFLFLVFTAIAFGLIYALHLLTKKTPEISRKVQLIFFKIENYSKKASNILVKPVFGIHEVLSTIGKFLGRSS